jgi:mono/diheme cytochrome c family protein
VMNDLGGAAGIRGLVSAGASAVVRAHKTTALAVLILAVVQAAHASEAVDTEYFEKKIRPLLAEHCLGCHGEKKQKGGLRLDSKAGWEKGGESGKAIVPTKAQDSLLIKMVQGTPGAPPQMPPDYVLSKELTAELVAWIDAGAPDPRVDDVAAPDKGIDWEAAAAFWSFKPVVAPGIPPAGAKTSPIDAFIAAKLAERKLVPVARADRRTLIRRATFGLTGLPPTRDEIAAFEADRSPEAFATVIDRLLASPRYGEHQARHWLDLARYGEDQADKEGKDGGLPHAWRYRDWVVEAFNRDVPYDRFVKLQIAADLMEGPDSDPADRRALGFLGLGAIYARPNDLDRKRAEEWDDRVDTLSRAFLGLTVSCARCHDHKYDPIPTQDYYSLAGIIANTKNAAIPIAPPDQVAAHAAAKAACEEADRRRKEFLQLEIDRIALGKLDSFPAYALACWSFAAARQDDPKINLDDFAIAAKLDPKIMRGIDYYLNNGGGRSDKLKRWPGNLPTKGAAKEPTAEARELAGEFLVIVRNNFAKPFGKRNLDIQNDLFGAEKGAIPLSEKAVLEVASSEWKQQYAPFQDAVKAARAAMPPEPPLCQGVTEADRFADLKVYLRGNPARHGAPAPRRFLRIIAGADAPSYTRGSGRLELAEDLASPTNPLTARVMVNRIWAQHFGRGIVASTSNFGMAGERPTHPELLDWLAQRFIRDGWSVKRLHREIMLTDTYQRSSARSVENEAIDADNRFLWRVDRRRLAVEAFRDAILAVCGNLDLKAGGPSGDVDDVGFVRRTIYGKVSRHDLGRLLKLFDFPAPNISADKRSDTTLPQQALFLLNSPFMIAQAKVLAARCSGEPTPTDQVRKAYGLALMRTPTEAETARAVRFLSMPEPADPTPNHERKTPVPSRAEQLAQVLLASNEFFYVD